MGSGVSRRPQSNSRCEDWNTPGTYLHDITQTLGIGRLKPIRRGVVKVGHGCCHLSSVSVLEWRLSSACDAQACSVSE